MSHFDSKSLHNICIVRLQGSLLLTSDNMITNSYQFSALEQRENSLCELTQVFFTDCILRNDAVNSMSFLLPQKSTGSFLSAEVFPTNLATNVYRRELNLINQPKTFTLPMVLVSHQIINNRSNSQCWVCA